MTYVTNLENRVKEKETASRKIAQQSIVDKKIKLAWTKSVGRRIKRGSPGQLGGSVS